MSIRIIRALAAHAAATNPVSGSFDDDFETYLAIFLDKASLRKAKVASDE